jgi:hypothetical protein
MTTTDAKELLTLVSTDAKLRAQLVKLLLDDTNFIRGLFPALNEAIRDGARLNT